MKASHAILYLDDNAELRIAVLKHIVDSLLMFGVFYLRRQIPSKRLCCQP
ncbi:MAG: hypothetical protein KDB01_06340 [Planctomycetaceae bacterium]|nr:hypothetical protein [Planctomycetaceae bacterium]